MTQYTYYEPDKNNNHVKVMVSRDYIMREYYPFWCHKVEKKYPQTFETFTEKEKQKMCIDDFIIIHWAWEEKE